MTIRNVTLDFPQKRVQFNIDLTDSLQSHIISNCLDDRAVYECELLQLLIRAIRPGDLVVDCGACTGLITLTIAAMGASVIAIEPGANNLPELYRNVEINNFPIEIRPVALGKQDGEREFLLMDDGGVNSFTQPIDRDPGTSQWIKVCRLYNMLPACPRVIKMDIEGSEYEALQGWLQNNWRCPYIAIEYNLTALDRAGYTGRQLRSMMKDHGYDLWLLFSDGMMPMLVPWTTQVGTTRQNVNVLFAAPNDVGLLWPEIVA